jgi:predicted DCC family thiol-disulfide oxidoreductase YuxK
MERRDRPVLIFDSDCGFCTASAGFIERRIPTSAEIEPFQSIDLTALGTTRERAEREVLWVDRTGRVFGGAAAVARLLRDAGRLWAILGLLISPPPLSWAATGVYRLVAVNRHRLPGGSPACAVPPPSSSSRPPASPPESRPE